MPNPDNTPNNENFRARLTFLQIVEDGRLFDRLTTPIAELQEPIQQLIRQHASAITAYFGDDCIERGLVFELYLWWAELDESYSEVLTRLDLPDVAITPVTVLMLRLYKDGPAKWLFSDTMDPVTHIYNIFTEDLPELYKVPQAIELLGERWKMWVVKYADEIGPAVAEARADMSRVAEHSEWEQEDWEGHILVLRAIESK